jgi:hypothetical protein
MMDTNDKDNRQGMWPDDDRVIYIPDEEYHSFMRSLYKLEQAQKELHRIWDGMKPEDGNSKGNDKQSL